MLDETTPKGKIIAAAARLAAERPWREVRMIDIAAAAGITLAEMRAVFDSRQGIVRGLVRSIDDALLASVQPLRPGDGARDALFEVVMARLDLMAPHKSAIRSIVEAGEAEFETLTTALVSQQWMLAAAGIDASGGRGIVRTLGLASIYASVLRTWLDDDDPGLARTMAALDRRLRRGERSLQAFDSACETVEGLGRRFRSLLRPSERSRPAPRPPDNDSG